MNLKPYLEKAHSVVKQYALPFTVLAGVGGFLIGQERGQSQGSASQQALIEARMDKFAEAPYQLHKAPFTPMHDSEQDVLSRSARIGQALAAEDYQTVIGLVRRFETADRLERNDLLRRCNQ